MFLFKVMTINLFQNTFLSKVLFYLKLLLLLCFIPVFSEKKVLFDAQQILFDGKTLNGWKVTGGHGKFSVNEKIRAIVGEYIPSRKNTFLYREINHRNFILKLKVKIDKNLNSGVQILSGFPPSNKSKLVGYQLEIDATKRKFTGGIYEEGLRKWLYPITRVEHKKAKKSFKVGRWNEVDIQVFGDTINTWINGVHCASLKDNRRNKLNNIIALQVHGLKKNPRKIKFILKILSFKQKSILKTC